MMTLPTPRFVPPLQPDFRPAALANRAFRAAAREAGGPVVAICLERTGGTISRYETPIFPAGHERAAENRFYLERVTKFLLWQRGGWRLTIGGAPDVVPYLAAQYSADGPRAFDVDLMGRQVYERPFEVVGCAFADAPAEAESGKSLGRHLDGCRIGFDLGASDRKSAAVIDGEPVWADEVPWDPRNWSDPQQHFDGINHSLQLAAEHLPRVDAIGGSAAGIYVDNQPRVASLFRGVSPADFDKYIRDLFGRLAAEWGNVPFEVVNDGEVTALAGSMSLGVNAILGVAMGSSEAGGYVAPDGTITDWLDELAFAPVDYSPTAPVDEWSGDAGVGALYFSQQAVWRLSPVAGIEIGDGFGQPEQLLRVQDLMAQGDPRARQIYESIGVYLGYTVAHYADFYQLENLLILGRVTSGEGGVIMMDTANSVIAGEFPELKGISIGLPDEKARRVGQSIAAASLPVI